MTDDEDAGVISDERQKDNFHAGPAVYLKDVMVQRGDTTILRGVNWSVGAGTCAAILGPNGSGKSTIARILACHMWPTSGEVTILGQSFGAANLPELRRSIRLVQAAGPYDMPGALSARDVVLTGFFSTLGLYDRVTDSMENEARRLLEQVGLERNASHAYSTLSSGERVRCLIARGLALKPRLLVLDEPTAGLDLLAREQVLATIQGLFDGAAENSPTVILITHHVEELPPATSNILLLKEGRVAGVGLPREVLRADLLSSVYGCALTVREAGGRYYIEVHPSGWEGLLRGSKR